MIVPVPEFGSPVTLTWLSLVQLNTVPATLLLNGIGMIGLPEHTVCGDGLLEHPLILLTVSVPTLPQAVPLLVPRIQPDATTLPLHLTSQVQALSLNVPCASMKKVNGAFVAGTIADGVAGGLNPYGPPLKITALSELRKVQVISSAQLPLPVMITCILPGVPTITAFGIGFTVIVKTIGVPTQLTPLV